MAKKRKKRYTDWGPTRRIDGLSGWELANYGTKSRMNLVAKQFQNKGYHARVLTGHSNNDCAVYIRPIEISEFQSEIGSEIRGRGVGRHRAAMQASEIKSQFIGYGSDAQQNKEKRELAVAVKDLQKKDVIEKIEPKTDIEPTYKLTKKGKELFDYDPSDWDE